MALGRLPAARSLFASLAAVGADPQDSDDERLRKSLFMLGALMFVLAGVLWGVLYTLLGEVLAGVIPLSYAVFSAASIVIFGLTRRYAAFRFAQLFLILFLPFLLMLALGGFVNSSAVILWSLLSPFGSLLFSNPREAPRWLVAYLGLVVASGLLQPYVRVERSLSPATIVFFFVLNIGAVSSIAVAMLYYFVNQKDILFALLQKEHEKSDSLLLNILPQQIAVMLKEGRRTIADYYEEASILFADLVGFTPLSAKMPPAEMVELLNQVFSHFDTLVERYGVEKIRTIGDSYMVAAGVPSRRRDHAQALAHMALDMVDYCQTVPYAHGRQVEFRIGINSGPVIAGVIGHKKFIYDLWGDAVNTASRMESHGQAGKIQITQATYELLKDEFECQPRGLVPVKGKGEMPTWFLVGRRAAAKRA
jgi:guanylate cyclase